MFVVLLNNFKEVPDQIYETNTLKDKFRGKVEERHFLSQPGHFEALIASIFLLLYFIPHMQS